jgi:hypothetical protein
VFYNKEEEKKNEHGNQLHIDGRSDTKIQIDTVQKYAAK